jgi:hypothetical protein
MEKRQNYSLYDSNYRPILSPNITILANNFLNPISIIFHLKDKSTEKGRLQSVSLSATKPCSKRLLFALLEDYRIIQLEHSLQR